MQEVKYTITDELGIHARPAGRLVKLLQNYGSDVRLQGRGDMVDAKRVMGVMSLAIKQGDEVTLTFNGVDEAAAAEAAEAFLKENL